MVNTASAAVQANESEKRRKQTLERAKANHLSRQLQMRLQYARLKVDHGWQKQNLNEVENLYFHHSHLRGPRPYLSSSSLLTTTNPASFSNSPNPTTHPHGTQSSLSFKLGSSNLTRNPTNANLTGNENGTGADVSGAGLGTVTTPPSLTPNSSAYGPSPIIDPTLLPSEITPLITMDVEQEEKLQSMTGTTGSIPSPQTITFPIANVNATINTDHTSKRNSSSKSPNTPHSPMPPPPTWSSSANPSHSNTPNQHQTTSTANLPTTDGYGFPTSSLTYDSFWSSHTAGTRSYRNPFSEPAGIGSGAPGDFIGGGGDIGAALGTSVKGGGKAAGAGGKPSTGGKNGTATKRRNNGVRVAAGREG